MGLYGVRYDQKGMDMRCGKWEWREQLIY
jgi:hypothetical protein